MADMPFDGYDKMTDDEVRRASPRSCSRRSTAYRAMIGRARDTAKPNGHKNMIAEFTTGAAPRSTTRSKRARSAGAASPDP